MNKYLLLLAVIIALVPFQKTISNNTGPSAFTQFLLQGRTLHALFMGFVVASACYMVLKPSLPTIKTQTPVDYIQLRADIENEFLQNQTTDEIVVKIKRAIDPAFANQKQRIPTEILASIISFIVTFMVSLR